MIYELLCSLFGFSLHALKKKILNEFPSGRASIGEAYHGDLSFADSLEAFGAGHDDPSSIAIGGCLTVLPCFNIFVLELCMHK